MSDPGCRVSLDLTSKHFKELVQTLQEKTRLLSSGKRLLPWEKATETEIKKAIESAAKHLPLVYQQNYVEPLIKNLDSVVVRSKARRYRSETETDIAERFNRNMEILAGAVYCHVKSATIPEDVVNALHCFLAVVSNTFRSFLQPSHGFGNWLPRAQKNQYPPLATFRNNEIAPYMLTSDVVEKTTGGTVGVVVLPANYKDHPLLWAATAHEVGGHEMLNACPQILGELQQSVRKLFFNGRQIQTEADLDQDALVGLLWQYWTEETVADVCGVLNLGPSYGVSLAVYQAALYEQLARKHDKSKPETLLRMWSTVPEKLARGLDLDVRLPDLDPHPVDILKLHVIIGAVDSLTMLPRATRNDYVRELKTVAEMCTGGKRDIHLCGLLQAGPDLWVPVNTYARNKPLELAMMQHAAQRVGACIATAGLNALDGRSLQDIATWDETDEEQAHMIAGKLNPSRDAGADLNIAGNTDDAQLLAGSTLAFIQSPERYEVQRLALMEALETSYARDYYWGTSMLHFFFSFLTEDADSLSNQDESSFPLDQPVKFKMEGGFLKGDKEDRRQEDA